MARLRPIEAVDDVEHRGLAGSVWADDGSDLAALDVKRHVGQRLHAAEVQGNPLDRQQRLTGMIAAAHAARSVAVANSCRSRILSRAQIVPLRPSSNVTSVTVSVSVEPS